jgi:hypothetical protein
MADGTIDLSSGLGSLFGALGGSPAKTMQYALSAQRGDLYSAESALAREKIKAAIEERERRARFDKPEGIDEILTAIGAVSPAQASAARRHFTGDPLRLPSDPVPPPPVEVPGRLGGDMGDFPETITRVNPPNIRPEGLDDVTLQKLGRIFGSLRGASAVGGKIDDVGQALRSFLGADLTQEQAGLARGGDPSTVSKQNRLGAASRGAAYEPWTGSSEGPLNQETGTLANPELIRGHTDLRTSEAGAARALAGQRGAAAAQTNLETQNLRDSGMKEPGRGRSVRGGASEPVYERKKRDWEALYPGDKKGALEYASGQRPFMASDARKLAGNEAKAKGLTRDDYDRYVRDASEEIIARNRGDDAGVGRIRLRNATSDLSTRAARIKAITNEDKRTKALQSEILQLQQKGFDAEEVKTILANAGLGG